MENIPFSVVELTSSISNTIIFQLLHRFGLDVGALVSIFVSAFTVYRFVQCSY